MWRNQNAHTLRGECKMVQPLWKVWQVLKKFNIELPADSLVLSIGTYPKGLERVVQTNTHMWLFAAALFVCKS